MNTELQNKVWSILPKEFRKEVKKMYESTQLTGLQPFEDVERADRYAEAMCAIFGEDNLTSDADELRKNGYEELSGKRLKRYKLTAEVQFGKEDNFASKKPKPAEPKEDKHFDNRLHIAAMAMQGILSNADRMKGYEHVATTPPCEDLKVVVARNALRYADELLRQSRKGDLK